MTPREKEQITEWSRAFEGQISLGLFTTGDPRSRALERFCEDFAGLSSVVRVVREEGGPEELPAITVGPAVTYHGVPLGTELDPFLEALSGGGLAGRSFSDTEKDRLRRIVLPAQLRLFVTPQCRFCPAMVRQLLPITAENESIRLTIVDGTLFPEAARTEKIQTVPTLLLDDQFRWTGTVGLHELMEVLANRDPVRLGLSSLENMLKAGEASRLAGLMLDREMIFPAFIALLLHNKWSVRLGAMVVMEEIAERNPVLALQAAGPLLRKFERADEQVKGDMIHVLGEVSDSRVIPFLKGIVAGDYGADIREAAEEALEKIAGRE